MINFNEYEITSKAVYSMDYFDFDRLVKAELPKLAECPDVEKYEFAASVEASNDSSHEFGSNTLYFTEKDEISFLENLKKGIWRVSTHDIIDFLMYKEVLPKGEYIISVSW